MVAGSKLEAYYRREIMPPFELVFAQIAAACQGLSAEVRGLAQKKVRLPARLRPALVCMLCQLVPPPPPPPPPLPLLLLDADVAGVGAKPTALM